MRSARESYSTLLAAGSENRCGGKETRTPDPLHAMQMLYQLSYAPTSALSRRHFGFVAAWRAPFRAIEG